MNKPLKVLSALVLTTSLTVSTVGSASASTPKVMWGKTELKEGQLGKVTVLKDTMLYKIINDDTITSTRKLKKGEEFRVYSYKNQNGGLFLVGGGAFILKDDAVKYETPSKSKLLELKKVNSKYDLSVHYPLPKGTKAPSIGNKRATWDISKDGEILGETLGFQEKHSSGADLLDENLNWLMSVNKKPYSDYDLNITINQWTIKGDSSYNHIPYIVKELSTYYGIPEILEIVMDYKLYGDESSLDRKFKVGNRTLSVYATAGKTQLQIIVSKPN